MVENQSWKKDHLEGSGNNKKLYEGVNFPHTSYGEFSYVKGQ